MSRQAITPVFETHHINVLRGAFFTALAALAVGLVDLFSDAWVMDYAVDSTMIIIVAAFAILSGCNAFLNSSVRVAISENHLKVSDGYRLMTGRSAAIPWEHVHTATLTLSPGRKGWLYRLLHRGVSDSVTLQYRWPERKMLAVPITIPLVGIDEVSELIMWIEIKADPTWKVYRGGMGSGDKIDAKEVKRIVHETFQPSDQALPERNETSSRTVFLLIPRSN